MRTYMHSKLYFKREWLEYSDAITVLYVHVNKKKKEKKKESAILYIICRINV